MLLPGLLLAVGLHAFHAMAVVTVIPQVTEELDGRSLYGAFFAAYLMASLLGLVWAGAALARRGARGVLGASLAVFGLGVLGSALAPCMQGLVAARVAEGFGGGGVSSVLYALVNRLYAEDERPRVLAWMASAWVLPGLLGPPFAGFVAEALGWRWVFGGVLPAALAAAAMVLPALGRAAPQPAAGRSARQPALRPDGARGEGGLALPALALAAGVGLLLLGLEQPPGAAAVACAVAGAALLLPAARRILPAGTLRSRPGLPSAIATKFLVNFAFFGAEAFLPLALREILGWSLTRAGSVLTAAALCWTAGAFVHSRLAARTSPRALALGGSLCILLGIAGVALLVSAPVPPGFAHLAWSLAGFGMGVAYNTSATCAMEETQPGCEGRTSTALGIADALGFALAAGLGGAILVAGERLQLGIGASIAQVCAATLAVGSLAAVTGGRLRSPEQAARLRATPLPT
jgi:MFS family permease